MNHWLERHTTLVLLFVGLLVAAGVGLFALKWQPVEPIAIEPPQPTQTPGPIRVYVDGAVAQPEVYTLAPNAIVRDALAAAGGPNADADITHINLAKPLEDGAQIHVPVVGEAITAVQPSVLSQSSETGAGDVPMSIININTASQAELEALPGIGPSIAGRIVEYRETQGPFASIEDIMNVSGIGPAIFNKIKDYITVD
jgi:competence protein ComEA